MNNFKFIETVIKDVYIVDVTVYRDKRGQFWETFKQKDFEPYGFKYDFIQDNQSVSMKGVLRGLHYQVNFPQSKLVRVIKGEIFDVAVDLRKSSSTYGKWVGVTLSDDNKKQLLIPRGFAHGFLVLSDSAEICYKCDEYYHPEDEAGITWNDPFIGIEWPKVNDIIVSDKDNRWPKLSSISEGGLKNYE